jgi:sialic acid synthase SpsE
MGEESQKQIQVIAEIGHNHNGDMGLAEEMIWAAKECGADVVKFQLYDIEKLPGIEKGSPVYWELKATQINREQLIKLKEACDKQNVEFMCSVFDAERVKWTEEINMKRYKIASRSVNDIPLIMAIEQTRKPMIVSLGKWEKEGFPPHITGQVDYLYCVAKYPPEDSDMSNFPTKFDSQFGYTGFSDHTIGTHWAKQAIRRGATIIEKHFTMDKTMPGCDQKGSAEPDELKEIIAYARRFSS